MKSNNNSTHAISQGTALNMSLLDLDSIEDMFELIQTCYTEGNSKLSKHHFKELDEAEQKQCIAFLESFNHYDMIDNGDEKEMANFINFLTEL